MPDTEDGFREIRVELLTKPTHTVALSRLRE